MRCCIYGSNPAKILSRCGLHLVLIKLGPVSCSRRVSRQSRVFYCVQVLLSAALDPPPAPAPTGIPALAATLRRALRFPGAAVDVDAALPPRRRRRVPPVRPQFPIKKKAVAVVPARRPRPAKGQVTVAARKPWRLPRLWDTIPATGAGGAARQTGALASAVTPFQAQMPAIATEQQQLRPASAAGEAPMRPLDAQLAAVQKRSASGVEGSRSAWRMPQLSGAPAAASSGGQQRVPAVEAAAVAAETGDDIVPAGPVEEELAAALPAPALAEQRQAAGELKSGSKHSDGVAAPAVKQKVSSGSADGAQAAREARLLQSEAAAATVGRRMLPLHQRQWPLPKVWLIGKDPWGRRSRQSSDHHANGAAAGPALGRLPTGPLPAAIQHVLLSGASNGAANGFSNGFSNGAMAKGSPSDAPQHGAVRQLMNGQVGSDDASASGAISPRTMISANAAAGLLDAQPPVASQRTSPRPFASSNGLAAPRPLQGSQQTTPRAFASSNGLAAARPPVGSQRTTPRPFASSNGLAPGERSSTRPSSLAVKEAGLNGAATEQQMPRTTAAHLDASAHGAHPADAAAVPQEGATMPAKTAEAGLGADRESAAAHDQAMGHGNGAASALHDAALAAEDVGAANLNDAANEGHTGGQQGEHGQREVAANVHWSAGAARAIVDGAGARQASRLGSPVRNSS